MKTHQSLVGQTFNRLTVEAEQGKHPTRREYLWLCKCSCGNTKVVNGRQLKEGKIQSCGCLNNENRVRLALANAAKRKGNVRFDLKGKRFTRLMPEYHFVRDERVYWMCVCDCGKKVAVRTAELRSGVVKSCGCYRNDLKSAECTVRNTTHGLSHSAEYFCWKNMVDRCFNPNANSYEVYGGAGRTVCEFLRMSPTNLLVLIGRRPSDEHSIDRINNNGNYSCGTCAECLQKGWPMNVRWATSQEQNRNRSNNSMFTINGETHCAAEWAERLNIPWAKFVKQYQEFKVTDATNLSL